MNKFSILIIALIAMFYSCTDSNAFTIQGKITKLDANTKNIVLEEIGESKLVPFDSVQVDEEGNFLFEGKIKEPKFFLLKAGSEFITLFVEPSDNITLNAEAGSLSEKYTVEGSKGSAEIRDFNVFLYGNLMKLDALGRIYQEALAAQKLDSVKAQVETELQVLIDSQKEYSKEFIERNLGSLINIFIIHQQFPPQQAILNPNEEMELFEKVLNSVKKEYPENMYVKSYGTFLTQLKQQLQTEASKPAKPETGAEAMEIALPSPQGDTISLTSLRGKYVLLDFWAAWCRPCRAENPNLVANFNKYGGKNFEIYQVSLDQTKEAWVGAIEKDNLGKWKHVSDLQYWNSAAAKLYGVQGIPANYLIDPEGKIIAQNLRGAALGQKLAEIFGK